MSNRNGADTAGRYEIRLQGHLHSRWAGWFDGLTVVNEVDGTAVISGSVADQAALHGLLHKVRDVGIPLISVTRVDHSIVDRHASTAHESEGK